MTNPSFIYDERDRIDSELERQEPPSKHAVAKHTPGPPGASRSMMTPWAPQ